MDKILITIVGNNGTLHLYEDRVVLEKTGGIAFLSGRRGTKTIPLSTITGVDYKLGKTMMAGFIDFICPGDHREYHGNMSHNNPNATSIYKKDNDKLTKVVEYAQNYIFQKEKQRNAPSGPSLSMADEILKYKNLQKEGIITEEEFEKKKKELLNK